ncbi:hypothetical protein [Persicirhabdus sediminis]|uniref:Uncharacterized protein n=1 Tax=Persicirhabdus sediminis TaxID=454144 RepID=A0A8J7SK98_9BACT|nr:hypothetical protein [Persicirhabdus sediminis]MBK1791909.1 hypothetical protein [Persicirhabdus sediminis]
MKFDRSFPFITTMAITAGVLGSVNLANGEAEPLKEVDKIALMEQLRLIQEQSDKYILGQYSAAHRRLLEAASSDAKAYELFIQCYEQVHFVKKDEKSQDFREWRRKNAVQHSASGFRRAIRHQIAWLLLTIEATQQEGEYSEMAPKTLKYLQGIMDDSRLMYGYHDIMERNVMNSVIVNALMLKEMKPDNWPTSPARIDEVFDLVILPQYRDTSNSTRLRQAWASRIRMEEAKHQIWNTKAKPPKDGKPTPSSSIKPNFQRPFVEIKPELMWEMEVDCFTSGDEMTSAKNMLSLVKANLKHEKADAWIKEFQSLVNGPESQSASNDSDL